MYPSCQTLRFYIILIEFTINRNTISIYSRVSNVRLRKNAFILKAWTGVLELAGYFNEGCENFSKSHRQNGGWQVMQQRPLFTKEKLSLVMSENNPDTRIWKSKYMHMLMKWWSTQLKCDVLHSLIRPSVPKRRGVAEPCLFVGNEDNKHFRSEVVCKFPSGLSKFGDLLLSSFPRTILQAFYSMRKNTPSCEFLKSKITSRFTSPRAF